MQMNDTASLLCIGTPVGLEFGVDYYSWETGPNFQGVKLIPSGTHVIYYNNEKAGRTCIFLHLSAREVVVLRWNAQNEDFDQLNEREHSNELSAYTEGVRRFEFDSKMGPYQSQHFNEWKLLSNFIDKRIIEHLNPIGKKILAVGGNLTPQEEKILERDFHSKSKFASTTTPQEDIPTPRPFYSKVPLKIRGADASATTLMNLDKTDLLNQIIAKYGDENCLLGEFQYAFAAFMFGLSWDSFDHWKLILDLICSCERGLLERSSFFIRFIEVFIAQLNQAPADFFVSEISKRNVVSVCLKRFVEVAEQSELDTALSRAVAMLKLNATKRFAVSFDLQQFDSSDEDAPVVVDLE
jgi:A1 cistron-splicing factor AAR2